MSNLRPPVPPGDELLAMNTRGHPADDQLRSLSIGRGAMPGEPVELPVVALAPRKHDYTIAASSPTETTKSNPTQLASSRSQDHRGDS